MTSLGVNFLCVIQIMHLDVGHAIAFADPRPGIKISVATLPSENGAKLLAERESKYAMLQFRYMLRRLDDDGAYFVLERRPAKAAADLAAYRQDREARSKALDQAADFADSDVQRQTIADYHTFLEGPNGYLAGNDTAFALKDEKSAVSSLKPLRSTPTRPWRNL
jgi:hypothetical protein